MSSDSTLRGQKASSCPLFAASVYQWHHSSYPLLSLFCHNLSPLPFFSVMPRPYLSVLSPCSFRRHFFSSLPVAHPGVTRFSVAGGRRQKVSGGSQVCQEVSDDTKLYHRERLMVTSHLVLKTYEYYAYLSVRQVIHPRHLINAIHAK